MARACIGIDLGGTFIKFGMLDAARRPGRTFQLPTPRDRGAQAVIEQMIVGARQLLEKEGLSKSDVVGVGIGSPGPISIARGVIIAMPNITGMDNVPLRDEVARGLGFPAVLENDANAAAFGEFLCGAGRGEQDLVLLTLGTGVGSGIVIGGKVFHGSHEMGAELGHMLIVPDGERCGCGQRGCLERYCSATFMAQAARRIVEQEGRGPVLRRVLDAKGSLDARDVNEARKQGDEVAAEVWDRAARHLAAGCVNICRAFDPDVIALSGGLCNAGDDLMKPLQEHFSTLHWKLTEPKTRIEFSRLGTDAGVIGAAGVAWQALA